MATQQNQAVPAWVPATFTAKVRGVDFPIASIHDLPATALAKIFEYGLQRISNDSAASAKTDDEAVKLAEKRWTNLTAGVIRSSGQRTGDPVKRRALELAEAKVKVAPKFLAWLAEAKLKLSDKAAIAMIRKNAEKHVAVEGNPFTKQAKIDVESAKGLSVEDLDIEV